MSVDRGTADEHALRSVHVYVDGYLVTQKYCLTLDAGHSEVDDGAQGRFRISHRSAKRIQNLSFSSVNILLERTEIALLGFSSSHYLATEHWRYR